MAETIDMEYRGLKVWVCSVMPWAEPGHFEDWSDLYEINENGEAIDKLTGNTLKKYPKYDRWYFYLFRDGKAYERLVYRCVATTFPEICGEYGERYEVDHINSDPGDDRACNLRWLATHKENMHNPATQQKIREGKQRIKDQLEANRRLFRPYL